MSNAAEMDAQEIINYIATAPKKTPVKLYVREKPGMKVAWGDAHVYGGRRGKTVFGDWDELKAILDANADSIDYYDVENDCRNSAVPMLDLKGINARIEPGAIIRDRVEIGDRAVIMMGAIINIGSVIGEGSMIDMGAVLGGRATVGKNCHIGAGTVLAGVVEPASATPVIIEDDVMIGANAVVLEGVRVGKGAVVAAGAVCVEDVPAGAVVAGVPARVIKMREGDYVVGAGVCRPGANVLTISEEGKGRRSRIDDYRITKRGGLGIRNYSNGNVAGIKIVDDTDDLILISQNGILIRIHAADINVQSRYGSGVRVMRLVEDDKVAVVARVDRDNDAETAKIEDTGETDPTPEELAAIEAEELAQEAAEDAAPENETEE